jgi:hypothetical protein
VKEAVEMTPALLHGSRRCGRRLLAASALVLLSAVLSSCGEQTGTSAVGPPITPSASSSISTTTPTRPTPSVTPASWRRIATPPFEGPAVWDGQEVLVVHSGSTWDKKTDVERCFEEVAAYDPATDSWRMLPPGPRITPKECESEWGGRTDAPVWTGTELLLWGATNSAYDPTTNSWRRLTAPPTNSFAPQATVWTGRQLIGWGRLGCCDFSSPDGFSFTPATGAVTRLPASPLQGGAGPVAFWTGSEMIVAGGGYEGGYVYDDVAAYRPATRSWRTLARMPVSRTGGTALWDGTELLVFGGIGGPNTESGPNPNLRTNLLARGVAYNPTMDSWRWLPAPDVPRADAVYVWDGREVLMWGGYGLDRSIPSHGEAFDPATSTWSPLPASPLRARVWPMAVWTGREWIVWGGGDARQMTATWDYKQLFDGAAFTPASG